jgi:uncharacterized protein YndB with AHSA1/START domain
MSSDVSSTGMEGTLKGPVLRDLLVTRHFDAPPERVWNAWSDPAQVMRWWGPQGFTSPTCRMDFRVGGTTIVHMRSPEFGDLYNTWTYREIVPFLRIEFINNFADRDGNTVDPVGLGLPPGMPRDVRHVVTFTRVNGSTAMTVTEYGYASQQILELSKAGLEQCLDKMAESLKD